MLLGGPKHVVKVMKERYSITINPQSNPNNVMYNFEVGYEINMFRGNTRGLFTLCLNSNYNLKSNFNSYTFIFLLVIEMSDTIY